WQPLLVSNNHRTCCVASSPGGVGMGLGVTEGGTDEIVMIGVGSGTNRGVSVAGKGVRVDGLRLARIRVVTERSSSGVGTGMAVEHPLRSRKIMMNFTTG